MSESDVYEQAAIQSAVALTKESYADGLQPTVKNIGKGLGYLSGFLCTLFCRPFNVWDHRLNAHWDRVEKEWEAKVNQIPFEERIEPSLRVAIPAVQGLQKSVEDDDLRTLFLNLLKSAVDRRTADGVLPAYAEILDQISSDEAKLLLYFCDPQGIFPFIDVKAKTSHGSRLVENCISQFGLLAGCSCPNNVPVYVDNLARLRLITIPDGEYYVEDSYYVRLENSPLAQEWKQEIEKYPDQKCIFPHRMLRMTNFGRGFCKACAIDSLRKSQS